MRKQNQRNVTVLVGLLLSQVLLGATNDGEVTLWRNISGEAKTEVANGVTWTYSPFEEEDCDLYDFTWRNQNLQPVTWASDFVRIPDILDGKPVVAIGRMAFTGCNIKTLIVPRGIKELDWTAFLKPSRNPPNYFEVGKKYLWLLIEIGTVSHVLFEGDLPKIVYPTFVCERASDGTRVEASWSNGGNPYGLMKNEGNVCWVYKECRNYVEKYGQYQAGSSYNRYMNVKIVPYAVATPCDGTVIQDSVDVSLSCATEGANIYYTTDGSEPSEQVSSSCFKYNGTPIRVATAGTIKTLVTSADCPFSKVYSHSYAQGRTDVVELDSRFGNEFYCSDNKITLSCTDADAVIRYSTDGTEVAEGSTVYTGPFTISDTTMVRARAYKTNWFPSDETIQVFTRKWYETETPVITAGSAAFDTASQEVTISCATEGATVYYTIDGSEPSAANGRVYKGPFSIYDSVTVKAVAVKEDWKDSAVASAAFTKNNGLSTAINMYDYLPETDVTYPWTVVSDVTHDGVSAVRSGEIGANGLTYLQLTVRGAGRLSFWWKTTCEPMWDGAYYDYASFKVGGALRACLAGSTEWRQVVMDITTTGKHVLRWEYQKDDADSIPPDCVWLDQVQWVPADDSGHTLTTGVPVPYSWLESYGFGAETDFEAAAKMKFGKVDGAGRAMSVEDDYVAGTDPTNLESKLTATIKMGADGNPILSWKPPLNGETEEGAGIREGVRRYSVLGKRDLGDVGEKWAPVAEGDESGYRFFKVKVEMP